MNLIVKLKDGKIFQIDDIDDYGIVAGVLMCMKASSLAGANAPMKNVCGFNLTDVHSYRLDGAVVISEVIYDSGASVIYETELVQPATV